MALQLLERMFLLLIVSIRLMHYPAAATLTTGYVGRPCPGELVTFTCTVSGVDLVWDPSDESTISLNTLTPLNTPVTRGQYTATLISNTSGLVSTLSTTARNGVTVECREPSTLVGSVTMMLVAPPSLPRTVRHTILSSTTDEAIVSAEWDPPADNGGRNELNYTVNISPSTQLPSNMVVTSTNVNVTADYNVNYTLSIVATNCAGNSATVEYLFATGGCPIPTDFMDGVLFPVASREIGSTVTFQCDAGLMSTEETATCLATLIWNPDPVTVVCSPVPTNLPPTTIGCSQPAPPANGFLIRTSNLTILFGCNEGYTPFGNMTANCIAMNLWSSVPAEHQCTEVVTGTSTILDTGSIVGITIVITLIVSVLIGLAIGMLLMYFIMLAKINKITARQASPPQQQTPPPPQQQTTPAGPVYEEVSQPKEEIELKTNQAYGPVSRL